MSREWGEIAKKFPLAQRDFPFFKMYTFRPRCTEVAAVHTILIFFL